MKITAVVGSYHRGGMIESAVDELLEVAQSRGAEVHKVNLLDARIEFCDNCQACTQAAGTSRGRCPLDDDMPKILDQLEGSDAIVLASPMNFFTTTALMKRFIERLLCYVSWPFGTALPKPRSRPTGKSAVLIVTSAAPGFMARFFTGTGRLLKIAARLLGASRVRSLYLGLSRHEPGASLSPRNRQKARALGQWLARRKS